AYEKIADSTLADAGKEIARGRVRATLIATAAELKNGGDVDRGAKAVERLLKLDPSSAEAKAAIDGAMTLAEKAAAAGDDKGAARLLRGASAAAGEAKDLTDAIIRFESGKYDEAMKELEHASSDLAKRTLALIRERKVGTLKAGLQGDDRAQAESI